MKQRKKNLKAFSVPEVLLSVFVLSIGLVTIVSLITGSLRYSLNNQNIIIASELTQEGIELVRNVRDNNFIGGGTGFAAFSGGNKHCRIDWNDPTNSLDCNIAVGATTRFKLNYTGGMYEHGSGIGRFSRYIYIDYNASAGDFRALVRSFVVWGTYFPPATGDTATCTLANSCLFSEAFLTGWK